MNPNAAEKQIEANLRAIEEARRVRKENPARPFATHGRKPSAPWRELRRAGYLR